MLKGREKIPTQNLPTIFYVHHFLIYINFLTITNASPPAPRILSREVKQPHRNDTVAKASADYHLGAIHIIFT